VVPFDSRAESVALDCLRVPQVEVVRQPGVESGRRRSPVGRSRWVEGKFLAGPIPLEWLGRASRLPGKALATGLAIWFLSGLRKGERGGLKLTSATLEHFHVNRHAKSRALRALESAGLISIQRNGKKNPVVTILGVRPDGQETAA
jgi:hypothetical protein